MVFNKQRGGASQDRAAVEGGGASQSNMQKWKKVKVQYE
jgi:hypothetical protein